MKGFVLFSLLLVTLVPSRADILGNVVELKPGPDWQQVDPVNNGKRRLPYPTIRYVPKNGTNARIHLMLMPSALQSLTVADVRTLRQFNLMYSQPYLPKNVIPHFTELAMPNGIAVYMTYADPALIDKPVPPGEYRITTSFSYLFEKKYVLHCFILYDTPDSAELKQALRILRSAIPVAE